MEAGATDAVDMDLPKGALLLPPGSPELAAVERRFDQTRADPFAPGTFGLMLRSIQRTPLYLFNYGLLLICFFIEIVAEFGKMEAVKAL